MDGKGAGVMGRGWSEVRRGPETPTPYPELELDLSKLWFSWGSALWVIFLQDSKTTAHPSRSCCPYFPAEKGRMRVRKGPTVPPSPPWANPSLNAVKPEDWTPLPAVTITFVALPLH